MTDRHAPPRDPATDAFEATLRAALQDDAANVTVPARLRTVTQWVVAQPAERRRMRPRLSLGPRGSIGSALATVVLLVAVVGATTWYAARPSGPGGDAAAISWDSGSVQFQADALAISGGGKVFVGVADTRIHSDPGSSSYRTFEAEWVEHGIPMRLNIYLGADDQSWWATEIRTYDGSPGGQWVDYPGVPLFKTPRGETYVGDLALTSRDPVPVSLIITGLRLTAFAPGTGPAEFLGCVPAVKVPSLDPDQPDPLAAGQPLAGTVIERMTPEQAGFLLRSRGLCHEYRLLLGGYSERWCVPPQGVIRGMSYGTEGQVIVLVADPAAADATPRPQPIGGWVCPTDQRGGQPPVPGETSAPNPSGLPAA